VQPSPLTLPHLKAVSIELHNSDMLALWGVSAIIILKLTIILTVADIPFCNKRCTTNRDPRVSAIITSTKQEYIVQRDVRPMQLRDTSQMAIVQANDDITV